MGRRTPQEVYDKGKRKVRTGLIGGGFFLFVLINSLFFEETTSDIDTYIIIGLIVLAFLYNAYRGQQLITLSKIYPDYLHFLQISPDNSLSYLAKSLGQSENLTRRKLNQMEKAKLFASMVINADNTIDIGDFYASHLYDQVKNIDQKRGELVSVTCSGCGATAAIAAGTGAYCEYCGSLIKS